MSLTDKQLQILAVIVKGNGEDASKRFIPVDLDQLIERLAYKPTKASIQFSIRAMVKHGLIEKGAQEHRRGRQRRIILATDLGRQTASFSANPGFVGATVTMPPADLGELREAELPGSEGSLFGAATPSEPQLPEIQEEIIEL